MPVPLKITSAALQRLAGLMSKAQPGAIGGQINALLREHGRKIGPDPASIQACMLGGILANNASGMCCGVQQNAYHTLDSLRLILPCGSLIDSAEPEAQARFEAEHPKLHQGLLTLGDARHHAAAVCSAAWRHMRETHSALLQWQRQHGSQPRIDAALQASARVFDCTATALPPRLAH